MSDCTKTWKRRAERFRARIRNRGSDVPLLMVFRSEKHIYAQIVHNGSVLVSASTVEKDMKGRHCTVAVAGLVGERIAKKALDSKIKKVLFDRGGFLYHGKIKALADGARKGGLEF